MDPPHPAGASVAVAERVDPGQVQPSERSEALAGRASVAGCRAGCTGWARRTPRPAGPAAARPDLRAAWDHAPRDAHRRLKERGRGDVRSRQTGLESTRPGRHSAGAILRRSSQWLRTTYRGLVFSTMASACQRYAPGARYHEIGDDRDCAVRSGRAARSGSLQRPDSFGANRIVHRVGRQVGAVGPCYGA